MAEGNSPSAMCGRLILENTSARVDGPLDNGCVLNQDRPSPSDGAKRAACINDVVQVQSFGYAKLHNPRTLPVP